MKKTVFLLAAAAIVASCNDDETLNAPQTAEKPSASELSQLVFGTTETRAHFVDGDEALSFVWDEDNAGEELVCAIATGDQFVASYPVSNGTVGDAEFASYLTIAPDAESPNNATFTTVNGYEADNLSALAGSTVYAVTPVAVENVNATATDFSVAMEMPNTFTQSASGNLEHLKPYMQMYATATIGESATTLAFKHIPAVLGFNIENSGTSDITVQRVTIDAVAADGILPSPLASAETTLSNTSFAPASSAVNYFSQITTLLGAEGTEIEAGGNYTAYALALPLASNMAADATLRIKVRLPQMVHSF